MKRRRFLGAGSLLLAPPVLAQQAKPRRIGFLVQKSGAFLIDLLVTSLRELGWLIGRNLQLESRLSAGSEDIAALASELAAARLDLIVTAGTHMARAASEAARTTPIVMYVSGWPVEGGLVASYARPGGNITGLSTYGGDERLFAKFLSLTAELVPGLRDVSVCWDYVAPMFLEKEVEMGVGELTRAAELLKLQARIRMIHNQGDLDGALRAMASAPMHALFLTSGPYISQPQNRQRIGELASRRRVPIINDLAGTTFRDIGVLAYSVNWSQVAARCASFVDRILRGARPGDLPIEQPTNFELHLHAGRAKAIGLKISPALLARADRVIE
jgi:putative ABC transport system substrate-binding protein